MRHPTPLSSQMWRMSTARTAHTSMAAEASRAAAHGRDVAEIGHGGLIAELPVAGERQVEVDAFGEQIGGCQDDATRPGLQDGGVVADTREDRRLHAVRDRCRPTEGPDQFELADPALAHQ